MLDSISNSISAALLQSQVVDTNKYLTYVKLSNSEYVLYTYILHLNEGIYLTKISLNIKIY